MSSEMFANGPYRIATTAPLPVNKVQVIESVKIAGLPVAAGLMPGNDKDKAAKADQGGAKKTDD
jgi:hypothetical protein